MIEENMDGGGNAWSSYRRGHDGELTAILPENLFEEEMSQMVNQLFACQSPNSTPTEKR